MSPSFSRGLDSVPESQPQFDPDIVPEDIRRDLCLQVLDHLGLKLAAEHTGRSELIHACTVIAGHKDQDAHPTGSLSYKKLAYHCLGCGSSGSLAWYIATLQGTSVQEAIDWLKTFDGVGSALSPNQLLDLIDKVFSGRAVREEIPVLSKRTLEPWNIVHPYLTDPWGPWGRGIPKENVRRFQVGYAESYRLNREGDTDERIVIPHFWKGDLVGWQARRLSKKDRWPKYIGSPGFPSGSTIFNYDPKQRAAVVVESMLSVIAKSHLAHIEATFGADVTADQVALLARHDEVILFMDADPAGWKSVLGRDVDRKHIPGLAERLQSHCMVKVVENPWDADPDDMTDEDFLSLVESAVPFAIWDKPDTVEAYDRERREHAHS